MGALNLDQILVTPLARIPTSGGDVMHAMKQTDIGFTGFGEAYFSWVTKGVVKGWKRHTRMTMNLVVPVGSVRFVFTTDESEITRAVLLGEEQYARISVPPGFWFGFQGLGVTQSLVLNIASIQHDPLEAERRALSDIDYNWNK